MCHEEQLLLRFFGRGPARRSCSGRVLWNRARNHLIGCFRHGVAQRAGQSAKSVISNRLPRLQIRACSALVGFERESSAGFFLEDRGGEGRYILLIPLPESSFVSRASSGIGISRRVKGSVTVNGNNKEERNSFFVGLERS